MDYPHMTSWYLHGIWCVFTPTSRGKTMVSADFPRIHGKCCRRQWRKIAFGSRRQFPTPKWVRHYQCVLDSQIATGAKFTWNLGHQLFIVIPFCQYMSYIYCHIVSPRRLWQSGTMKYVDFSLMTEDTKKSSALSENRVPWVTHRVADLLFWGP